MNIFYLDRDPKTCAEMHNDKHVVKMILEYAQLLSTAHRIIDGVESTCYSKTGRKQKRFVLPDDRESILYAATHANHPSAVWARTCKDNYVFLHTLLDCLCKEYTHRYSKVHKVERDGLLEKLTLIPHAININKTFTEPTPAMPEEYKVSGDSIQSYRNYYVGSKVNMSKWTSRKMPVWFEKNIYSKYDLKTSQVFDVKKNKTIEMPVFA